MLRKWLPLLAGAAAVLLPAVAARATEVKAPKQVFIIPIRDEIDEPALYTLRRGLKEAIASHADAVVLDLKTPGGELSAAFDMMEALENFHGLKIAFVDDEAMSAGAFISAVTDEIWFVPTGIIGAAAPVTSTGQDVDSTMKEKLVSYLRAKMRAISEGKGFRGEVISAMIDENLVLEIDGKVLKEKGSLLSLTADEAMKTYGNPPEPLLGAGIAPDLDGLLAKRFGEHGTVTTRLEETWSEHLAVWLNGAAPILLGLGLLSLFLAFKMGGFGTFGVAGIVLLAAVFFGSSVAGLSGHEPAVLFALGVLLLVLELIFFHSAGFLGVVGVAFMLLSLLWSMADLWPGEPVTVAWNGDAFVRPLYTLGAGIAIAAVLAVALLRYLPQGWIWGRLVIGATVGGNAQVSSAAPGAAQSLDALIGARGIAATALRPMGQVEVGGRRYEARVEVGDLQPGTPVVVRGRSDFSLVVEKAS